MTRRSKVPRVMDSSSQVSANSRSYGVSWKDMAFRIMSYTQRLEMVLIDLQAHRPSPYLRTTHERPCFGKLVCSPIYPVDLPWIVASNTSVGLDRTPQIPADVSHSRSSFTMGADTSMIELLPLNQRAYRFVLADMLNIEMLPSVGSR